jgi:hypothetical protein
LEHRCAILGDQLWLAIVPLDEVGIPRIQWKWVLLALGGLGLSLTLGVAAHLGVFSFLEDAQLVQSLAGDRASSHSAVVQALGGPVLARHGSTVMHYTVSEGAVAEGTMPVEGKNLPGSLYFRAHRSGEGWEFAVLRLTVQPSHREINLLTEPDDVSLLPAQADPAPAPSAPPLKTKAKHAKEGKGPARP